MHETFFPFQEPMDIQILKPDWYYKKQHKALGSTKLGRILSGMILTHILKNNWPMAEGNSSRLKQFSPNMVWK